MVKLLLQSDQHLMGTNHHTVKMLSALQLQGRLALRQKKSSDNLLSITLLGTGQGKSDVRCTVMDDNGLISSAYYGNLHSRGPLLIKQVHHGKNHHVRSSAAEDSGDLGAAPLPLPGAGFAVDGSSRIIPPAVPVPPPLKAKLNYLPVRDPSPFPRTAPD